MADAQSDHAAALKAERQVMKTLGVTRSQARDVLHGFAAETSRQRVNEASKFEAKNSLDAPRLQITEQKIGNAGAKAVESVVKPPVALQPNLVYGTYIIFSNAGVLVRVNLADDGGEPEEVV